MLLSGRDLDTILSFMQTDLNRIDGWFFMNRLALNKTKTKWMLFTSSRSRVKGAWLNMRPPGMINRMIEQITNYKYLGIWVDEHLTFKDHINSICDDVKARTTIDPIENVQVHW